MNVLIFSKKKALALSAGLALAMLTTAVADTCLNLPGAPNNEADSKILVTFGNPLGSGVAPFYSLFQVSILPAGGPLNSPVPPIPPGDYAAWCFDQQTTFDSTKLPPIMGGFLYSSCDPNLNTYLPDHPNVKPDPSLKVWNKVNWIINNRSNCGGLVPTMIEVQRAIYALFGQTTSLPIAFRQSVVDCLVAGANANSDFTPGAGQKVAVIYVIDVDWTNSEFLEEVQLIFLEVPVPPACLGDLVWHDSNANGVQEPGEEGIPNVKVDLYDCAGNFLRTTTTDANGNYLFCDLSAGDYKIIFETPSGYTASPQGQGADECKDSDGLVTVCINVEPGETDLCWDQGFYRPACLGDLVWHDLNADGVQDVNEPGIPGVQVDLYVCNGGKINSMVTDANGNYLFCDLAPGDYYVVFHQPEGLEGVSPKSGTSDTCKDSDGLTTVCITLDEGETDLCWDQGLFKPPCPLVVTKDCLIPPGPPAPFDCSGAKPIDSLSMRWGGTEAIGVKAWKGSVGSTLLASLNNVAPGDVVTVTGYAGSPNDVYWELFQGTVSGPKLGESTFHVSCSDIDMNGSEDCGKWAGDGKAKVGFINLWIFEGMAGNGKVLGCTAAEPATSANCTVKESPFASCETLGKPTSLTFRYTGGGCAASNNPQSGKATCSGAIDPLLPVTIASLNGYTVSPASVAPGEEFTVTGSFGSQSTFTLKNSGGTATISIHTSCSQALMVGDVYGDLTLVAFNGQTGGSSIIYRYTVLNNGPAPLANIMLIDDQLGDIAGPFELLAGEVKSWDVPVQLNDTSVNIATATILGTDCEASSGPVTVTVLRNCPVPVAAPFKCATPIDSLSMTWTGEETIGVKAWKGAKSTTLLGTFDGVTPGTTVTVSGYAGAPNDVYWEIFAGTTAGSKLGESTFHLSCSDADMNGPEDCGKLQGDGKGKVGYINKWLFAGMVSGGVPINCNTQIAPLPTVSGRQLKWLLSNQGDSKITMTGLTLNWPASNKKLLKVKFDGDVIWDTKSAAGATSITLNIADLTSDTKKKSLEPGATRTFILEFEADASPDLNQYQLTVSFGACSLSL